MEYNDNQIIPSHSTNILNEAYQKNITEEINDLIEIHSSLVKQRDFMLTNNSQNNYDSLIEKTNRHIESINTIIKSTAPHSTQNPKTKIAQVENSPQPHLRPYINSTNNFDTNNSVNNEYLGNEINLPNTNNNIPNIQPNLPLDSSESIETTPRPDNNQTNIRNNRNRTSPLQGNVISYLARAIFGKKIKSKNIIIEDYHRNRFHNNLSLVSTCQANKKIVTNQLDILRLLLLYISLRPHCRFIRSLSNITFEQMEILTELIS